MDDNHELNDSAVLSAVRDSISGLDMPTAPRLEAITARGRARRRRRLAGLSIAAAGACAALVVGLVGGSVGLGGGSVGLAGGAGSGSGSAGPVPAHKAPPVHLAAFSVVTGPDGATTLTLYPGQVANPNAVRQALAEHGIPAVVTAGKFCRTASQPAPGVGQVVVLSQQPPQMTGGPGPRRTGKPGPIVIYGSAIPRGVELSIGYRQDPQSREISFTLIQAGAPLTCTSIPDNGPHGDD
jgi:hypothetical protein